MSLDSASGSLPFPAIPPLDVARPGFIPPQRSAGGSAPPPLLLGSNGFLPRTPQTLKETGLGNHEIEALVLKFLLNSGSASGKQIFEQLKLPSALVRQVLHKLKEELLIVLKAASGVGDYIYQLTDEGGERARRYAERCTYYGAAPVALDDYVQSVLCQSIKHERPTPADLCRAFADLSLRPETISQIGQAVTAGRGLFLHGPPGNGKTSVAERITRSFGQHLWIPRTVSVTGELIRLYDPSNHDAVALPEYDQLSDDSCYDRRWVLIRRPTIVVGGELTLAHLDIQFNPATGIHEAPVHMKSNGGTLVIDDFGRQRVSSADLLNRWIVPLEKRHDYLNLPSGRQIQMPFEQLLVFSTNLEPRDLVDEAFLRRIPYKIEVRDPSGQEFHELFRVQCEKLAINYDGAIVEWLMQTHFTAKGRAMHYCHPRDILSQIHNLCTFHDLPRSLTKEYCEVAVRNYFSVL